MAGRHRRQKKRVIKKVGLPLAVVAGLAIVVLLIFTALKQRQQIQQSQFSPVAEERPSEDLSTVEEVLAAFLARSGGDAVTSLKSMRFSGQLTNANGSFTISVAKRMPNLSRTNVASVTGQQFTRIWDGTHEWINEGRGWQQQATVPTESDNLHSISIRAALGQARAALTGKEVVEGIECYVIELTHPQTGKFITYIDTESLLERRLDVISKDGERQTHYYYDHQDMNGIVSPRRAVVVEEAGERSVLEIASISFNPGLMVSLFEPQTGDN